MIEALYESPLPLAVTGGLLAVVFWNFWNRRRKPHWLAATFLSAALVPVAWLIDDAVETDREQIVIALYTIVIDYRDRDLAGVQAAISSNNLILNAAAIALIEKYNFTDERLTDISVTQTDDGYDNHFRLNADFVAGNYGSVGRRPTRWIAHWVREDDRWKIADVTELDALTGETVDRWKKVH